MRIKSLVVTLLIAVSMWAQNAALTPTADVPSGNPSKSSCCKDGADCCKSGSMCCKDKESASCCKDGASCCKEGVACSGKKTVAKADCCKAGSTCCKPGAMCCAIADKATDANSCCGGKMCARHRALKV